MSTSTLSERLRAMYQEMRRNQDRIIGWDTNLFFEAIAALEAREPKVMADEEIDKAASAYMAKGWDEDPPHDHPAKDAAYTEIAFRDGLRYARDHGYVAPLDRSRMEEGKSSAVDQVPTK